MKHQKVQDFKNTDKEKGIGIKVFKNYFNKLSNKPQIEPILKE